MSQKATALTSRLSILNWIRLPQTQYLNSVEPEKAIIMVHLLTTSSFTKGMNAD